jgi:hypothetical protein
MARRIAAPNAAFPATCRSPRSSAVNPKLTMIGLPKKELDMQTLYLSPHRKQIAAGIIAASLLSLATPLVAQATSAPTIEIPDGSTLQDVLARQKVNQDQANFARNQLAQNAANQAAYERQLAEVDAAKAKIAADDAAARSAYEAESARVEAEGARIRADHAAAMAKWEADVAACNAGNYRRCSGG